MSGMTEFPMNQGFDPRIADWLEDHPDHAPGIVLAAVLAAFPSIPQRRASRLPWRVPSLNPALRLAGAAIVVVLAIGVLASLGPSNSVGPVRPTASPRATRPPNLSSPAPVFPASPLPDPTGADLPANLIGRTYGANPPEVQGTQQTVLTLRAADDPHCVAMFEGRSTCFTYLWTPNYPRHITDPGARGSATIIDGQLVLSFDLVEFDPECVGQRATYTLANGGDVLLGVNPPACTVPGFVAVTVPPD